MEVKDATEDTAKDINNSSCRDKNNTLQVPSLTTVSEGDSDVEFCDENEE